MEKNSKKEYLFAVGRRREAVARIRLYSKGTGKIIINDKPVEEYFSGSVNKTYYSKPFAVTNTLKKFDVTVRVVGGGLRGQLGAVVHGIARVLEKHDKALRPALKKAGLLTRDPRERQRRMIGTGGKARRKKQSPKR